MLRLIGIPSLIDEVRVNRLHVCTRLIGELWHSARLKCATDNDLFERFSLGLDIGSRLVIGRVKPRVPEPAADPGQGDRSDDEIVNRV